MGRAIGDGVTEMGKRITAKIEFSFDEDTIYEGMEDAGPMTDDELHAYVLDSFVEDIHNFVKFNEVASAVQVKITPTE